MGGFVSDHDLDRAEPDPGAIFVSSRALIYLSILVSLLLPLCVSCEPKGSAPPPPAGAIPPDRSIGSASVSGRVVLDAPPPRRETIRITEANCRHDQSEPPLTESAV